MNQHNQKKSYISMYMQEDEVKEKNRKIEYAEQCLTTLNMELKVCLLDCLIVS